MIVVIAANRLSAKATIMKEQTINTSQPENEHEESTYALLIRSEEKRRNLIETTLYSFLILGAVIAIWQFVHQPVDFQENRQKTQELGFRQNRANPVL
jgi:cytoskeletal protein RodZ